MRGRRRFQAAQEGRLDGIMRKAVQMQEAIEMQAEVPAVTGESGANGSGQTPAERQGSIDRQNDGSRASPRPRMRFLLGSWLPHSQGRASSAKHLTTASAILVLIPQGTKGEKVR